MVQVELFCLERQEEVGKIAWVEFQKDTGRPAGSISTRGWEEWAVENLGAWVVKFEALVSEDMARSGTDPTLDPRLLRFRQVSEQCRMVWGERFIP